MTQKHSNLSNELKDTNNQEVSLYFHLINIL